jgi:hypothetical protein
MLAKGKLACEPCFAERCIFKRNWFEKIFYIDEAVKEV